MNQTVVDWLLGYFSQSQALGEDPHDRDIFEAGWIDSFGVILLIEELESEFDFKFSHQHLSDRRFRTINGIAELVHETTS